MKYDENFHIILPVDKYESMVEFFLHSLGGKIFKKKLNDFAKRMDVHFNMVRIKNVKTIWGSCSSKKNLNFNFKLFFLPERLIDYVCVHELAHLKQMNHSKVFGMKWNNIYQTTAKSIKPLNEIFRRINDKGRVP